MRLWAHRYVLRAKGPLGALAHGRERVGALIRAQASDWEGFADAHPWVELGDPPLSAQLESLAAGQPLALAARSLAHARSDGEARARKQSAFAGLEIPLSHWLCPSLASLASDDLSEAAHAGFKSLKAKAGRDWPAERERLCALASGWPDGLVLRLDFAASLSRAAFVQAWESLPAGMRARVEFVEDPCPWDDGGWRAVRAAGAPTAYDRPGAMPAPIGGAFDVLVLKPAAQDAEALARAHGSTRFVVTSYLDHPLGQASAALAAAKLRQSADGARMLECGLLSQRAYEATEFSEALAQRGPAFLAPEGTGLGFDELLSRLDWRAIA